jgi:hypothetical protein
MEIFINKAPSRFQCRDFISTIQDRVQWTWSSRLGVGRGADDPTL